MAPGFIFCHPQAIDVSGEHNLQDQTDKTAVAFCTDMAVQFPS